MFAIPDPRWEEPNLLIPGKKPTGPVDIDWNHPLSHGLVAAAYVRGSAIVDLVTGNTIAPSSSVTFSENRAYLTGTGDNFVIPNPGISSDWSMVLDFQKITTPSAYGRIIMATDDGNPQLARNNSDTQFSICGTASSGHTNIWDGQRHMLLLSARNTAGVDTSLYVDGYLSGTNVDADANRTWAAGDDIRIGNRTAGDRYCGGAISFVWVYNYQMEAFQRTLISKNPYQILIPK